MLKGTRKYWLIAIVCGLLAAGLFYQYIQTIKAQYLPRDLVTVIKAAEPISEDTIIVENQLKTAEIPAKYAHPEVISKKAEVIGKIALTDIAVDEEILPSKINTGNISGGDGLAYIIPPGRRAVAIPIDSVSGVAGFLKVGDHVDIIATLDLSREAVSVVALQDIEILAIGNNTEAGNEGTRTLTLAVSLSDARPLVLATERGTVRLLLRPAVDKTKEIVAPFSMEDFLNQGQADQNQAYGGMNEEN